MCTFMLMLHSDQKKIMEYGKIASIVWYLISEQSLMTIHFCWNKNVVVKPDNNDQGGGDYLMNIVR